MADGNGTTDARAEAEAKPLVSGGGTFTLAPAEVAIAHPTPVTPMEMLGAALARGDDLTVLEKLMDLQDRHERKEARKAFDAAISDAKAKIPPITKNRRVNFESKTGGAKTDYMHEDLAEIARVITPILSDHGLSYRFRTHYAPNEPVMVTCIISHRMGHSEENTLPGPPDNSGNKNSLQAIGSTLTYLQRMTLKASLGLAASNDDDGRGSSGDSDPPIDAEQLKALQALLDKGGTDIEKFCAHFKVEALPDLRKSQFENARAALWAKAKKQADKKGAP